MDEQETVTTQAGPEPEPEKASRWEDYIDVFFSPFELFRRRAHDKVAPPLLTLLALGIVFYLVMIPANRIVVRGSIPPEQQAQMSEGMINIMSYAGVIGVPLMYLFMTLIAAALLWVGARIIDIRADFSRTMLIATYAAFVLLLSQILASVLVMIGGEASFDIARSMSFGPLRFIGSADMNRSLSAVLQRFDIFAIWQAALWAIGLSVIYKVSMGRAAAVAAVVWILFAVPGIVMGLLGIGGPPAT
ncbi:MAG TPA: YIP1 family protein [Longimicrobiales bacterium]|nr:YIP1 family protein [Longimicrobiales bacterium]